MSCPITRARSKALRNAGRPLSTLSRDLWCSLVDLVAVADVVALTATSRALRAALLSIPFCWTRVTILVDDHDTQKCDCPFQSQVSELPVTRKQFSRDIARARVFFQRAGAASMRVFIQFTGKGSLHAVACVRALIDDMAKDDRLHTLAVEGWLRCDLESLFAGWISPPTLQTLYVGTHSWATKAFLPDIMTASASVQTLVLAAGHITDLSTSWRALSCLECSIDSASDLHGLWLACSNLVRARFHIDSDCNVDDLASLHFPVDIRSTVVVFSSTGGVATRRALVLAPVIPARYVVIDTGSSIATLRDLDDLQHAHEQVSLGHDLFRCTWITWYCIWAWQLSPGRYISSFVFCYPWWKRHDDYDFKIVQDSWPPREETTEPGVPEYLFPSCLSLYELRYSHYSNIVL